MFNYFISIFKNVIQGGAPTVVNNATDYVKQSFYKMIIAGILTAFVLVFVWKKIF